jgi:hypothetical protein
VRSCRRKKDKGCFELREKGKVIAIIKPLIDRDKIVVYAFEKDMAIVNERQLELLQEGPSKKMTIRNKVLTFLRRG